MATAEDWDRIHDLLGDVLGRLGQMHSEESEYIVWVDVFNSVQHARHTIQRQRRIAELVARIAELEAGRE